MTDAVSTSPEWSLLLSCIRSRVSAGTVVVPSAFDPQGVLRLAMEHHVLPAVQEALPADGRLTQLREMVHDRFLQNAAKNAEWTAELNRLAGLLQAEGVPVIALRGPAMAQRLYGDIAMRQFADLDLLVHRTQAADAMRVIAAAGYAPQFPLTPRQQSALVRFRTERIFMQAARRRCIDLHWQLLPGSLTFAKETDLWNRSILIDLAGTPCRVLSDVDNLLYLCAHGAKHGWDRLVMCLDTAVAARRCGDAVSGMALDIAHASRKERVLLLGLMLACEVTGLTLVGDTGARMISHPALDHMVSQLKDQMSGKPGADRRFVREGRVVWSTLRTARDQLRYIAELVVVPSGIEIERWDLPVSLRWGYCVLRVVRLLARHTFGRWRRREERGESS